jgi:tRNA nucleotidyltransferase (CCA-adding enzyme)
MNAGTVAAHVARYIDELRHVAPLLDGHALRALGIAPGPQMGRLLSALRVARLDGLVQSRADEEAWVRQHAAADAASPPHDEM